MKLNNKGISLVEIIISITLISIIIIFILGILINIRTEEQENKELSQLKLNQAIITKEIQTDFIERELIGIEPCNEKGVTRENDSVRSYIKTRYNSLGEKGKSYCLKFIYNPAKGTDNIGYLLYYSYSYESIDSKEIFVMGYRRGNKSVIRETQVSIGEVDNGTAKINCQPENHNLCVLTINMPIKAKNGDDYGINLSYLSQLSQKELVVTLEPDLHYKFDIDKKYE